MPCSVQNMLLAAIAIKRRKDGYDIITNINLNIIWK